MKTIKEDINTELKAAEKLLSSSWNNDYRKAYLAGKIYVLRKLLEQDSRGKYNKVND